MLNLNTTKKLNYYYFFLILSKTYSLYPTVCFSLTLLFLMFLIRIVYSITGIRTYGDCRYAIHVDISVMAVPLYDRKVVGSPLQNKIMSHHIIERVKGRPNCSPHTLLSVKNS